MAETRLKLVIVTLLFVTRPLLPAELWCAKSGSCSAVAGGSSAHVGAGPFMRPRWSRSYAVEATAIPDSAQVACQLMSLGEDVVNKEDFKHNLQKNANR